VTITIISIPSVIITLFFKNVPVQSIQVTYYPVPFPLTKTAIFFHALNLVENLTQLFVEFACFMPVESSPFDTLFNLFLFLNPGAYSPTPVAQLCVASCYRTKHKYST